ncbi:MAG: hypothetical protein M0R80_11560 [Proteobacteria bacterium]|jgi:hypothetical protein|nr:hypothetical protein [Pseudomonadota bacterium]
MGEPDKKPIGPGDEADEVLVAELQQGENLCVRAFPRDVCEFRPAGRGPAALWIETMWRLEAEESFAAAEDSQVRFDVAPRFPEILYSMSRTAFLCWSRT